MVIILSRIGQNIKCFQCFAGIVRPIVFHDFHRSWHCAAGRDGGAVLAVRRVMAGRVTMVVRRYTHAFVAGFGLPVRLSVYSLLFM